jgi:hypothetical protein
MSWADDMGFSSYMGDYSNDEDNIWITKDGKEIDIRDMEDSHLLNACRKFNDERLLREMVLRLFGDKARGQ